MVKHRVTLAILRFILHSNLQASEANVTLEDQTGLLQHVISVNDQPVVVGEKERSMSKIPKKQTEVESVESNNADLLALGKTGLQWKSQENNEFSVDATSEKAADETSDKAAKEESGIELIKMLEEKGLEGLQTHEPSKCEQLFIKAFQKTLKCEESSAA